MDYIQKNTKNDEILWWFKRISGHQRPLRPGDHHYAGTKYNVQVKWETGKPLNVIAADDPITCAVYVRDNDLLNQPGWKRFKKLAAEKQLLRLVRQGKMGSFKSTPHYKFGHHIPANYDEALAFNMANSNTKWQDATTLEMMQLFVYDCFEDGSIHGEPPNPKVYKKIRGRLVFDQKHNGCHKASYVAGGHLADIPVDSIYSGVVSLCGLRIVTFLAELNDVHVDLWSTDVGNAYLEALTKENIYIVASPEFRELEGHILIIWKALYGLCTSGLWWHETFADCLYSLGFELSWSEPDIWMQQVDDHYEYVTVYVDYLAIASKDPKAILNAMTNWHGFKLKGTGLIEYHLGMTFAKMIMDCWRSVLGGTLTRWWTPT